MLNPVQKATRAFAIGTLSLFTLVSCAFVVEEDPDEYDDVTRYEFYEYPSSSVYVFDHCDERSPYYRPNSKFCAKSTEPGEKETDEEQDLSWSPNCKGQNCASVPIYVHYLLQTDLGPNQVVWVEAFNNPFFQGAAEASLYIGGFDTSQPQSSRQELMFLEPGEYYFRAYIHSGIEPAIPLVMQGMQLVSEKPLGVYGALSCPQRFLVKPGKNQETVHIEIDQLLEKAGQGPQTDARIRIRFNVDPDAYIEADRDVLIQLLDSSDINEKAQEQFRMSSNELLISTRPFQAEFITPELPVGRYFVFAFLDENDNGYYDFGELAQISKEYDQVWPVTLEEKATATITLPLEIAPDLP